MPKSLVTTSEIARMADVSPAAVCNWKARHKDFPLPVDTYGVTPVYDLKEVMDWIRNRKTR